MARSAIVHRYRPFSALTLNLCGNKLVPMWKPKVYKEDEEEGEEEEEEREEGEGPTLPWTAVCRGYYQGGLLVSCGYKAELSQVLRREFRMPRYLVNMEPQSLRDI